MTKLIRLLRDEKGDTVIGFTIVMHLLALMLGLLITFFMLMQANLIVVDANRDGARHEALNLCSATGKTTEQVVRESIGFARLPSAGSIVSVGLENSTNYVTVTTRYLQPSLVPRLPELFGGSPYPNVFVIEAKTAFKKERS